MRLDLLFDFSECGCTIDAGFTGSEQVQIGTVQNQNMSHADAPQDRVCQGINQGGLVCMKVKTLSTPLHQFSVVSGLFGEDSLI